jgi:hypothetical protein
MTSIETLTARIEALREARQEAMYRQDYDEASRLDALISEADMDLSQCEEDVAWLEANVSPEDWDRLVGSQTREEFAADCGLYGRHVTIEDNWADYLDHAASL